VWGSRATEADESREKRIITLMQSLVNNGEGTVRGPRLLDCPRVLAANFHGSSIHGTCKIVLIWDDGFGPDFPAFKVVPLLRWKADFSQLNI
jgi:hypothetical protein